MRFRPTFDAAGFVAVGSTADDMRGDAVDERLTAGGERQARSQERQEVGECLQCSLKTDLPGWNLHFASRHGHHAANQIVSQEVHEEFVAHPTGPRNTNPPAAACGRPRSETK